MTSNSVSKKALFGGWILTILPALLLLMSAGMKLAKPPAVVDGFKHFGLPATLLTPLGVVELVCTLLYLIPRTAVLGAVLLTGYLGGAILTHVRVGESFVSPFLLGVAIWGGVFLRDPRLRALLPLRR